MLQSEKVDTVILVFVQCSSAVLTVYFSCLDNILALFWHSPLALQPQFINLAQIWSGFQDEMVLLSVLSNILVSLEPFTRGHRELFHEEVLVPYLEGVAVKTDEQRLQETMGSEHRVGVLIRKIGNNNLIKY